jgi:signal transduction histidine kinase
LKDEFLALLSHELRTPLGAILVWLGLLRQGGFDPAERERALEIIERSAHSLERIIEDLLQLAKSDASEMLMEIKDLSLSDLILEVYMQGRALAEGRELTVELKLEVEQEIRIQGDELRLRQIFLNLIVNAIKYTPDPGLVQICLATAGDNAVVKVIDNGIGIPDAQLPHIFDRFYRVDQARNRAVGGAGLGLAIVKWLVAAHDGRIEVLSEVGVGSTFQVTLPMAGPARA